jgi:hypothetical protein
MNMEELLEVKKAGYAGVMKDGRLVDRRRYPAAMPIPKNEMLGVPEPRKLVETLSAWCDGTDTYVAATLKDALKMQREDSGVDECDQCELWKKLEMDKPLTIVDGSTPAR